MVRKHVSDQSDLFEPSPQEASARRWDAYEPRHIEQFRKELWDTVAMLRQAEVSPWQDPARALSEEVCFHGKARYWFEEEEALRIRRAFVMEALRLQPRYFWPLFIDEVAPDLWESVRAQMDLSDASEDAPG